MFRLLASCCTVLALCKVEPECTTDSGLEECIMKVDLLQKKIKFDAEGESMLALEGKVGRDDCKSWCAGKVSSGAKTWDQICSWTACSLCDDCPTTTTTTTTTTVTEWQSPYFAMTCDGTQIKTTPSMTYSQYDVAVASVQSLYNSLSSTCNATYCPQADWAGCVLRIAGHDFMDYKDGEGGSDGCIDFHDADNAGLAECIHTGEHGFSLADAYKDYCTSISLADFFVIAAEAVMNVTRQHVLDDDATRSAIDFRSNFKWGRTTALNCEFAEGRLPNPENSCSAVNATFVQSMGLSWSQAAALSAVHTLGRAHVDNSGYNGWWSDAINSRKFNNDYFVSILAKGWGPETNVNGNPDKNQWMRIDSGADEANLGKEMMLNTDLCLYFTMDTAGDVEMDAKTAVANECNCTWPPPTYVADAIDNYNNGEFCGSTTIPGSNDFPAQRALCCGSQFDSTADEWVDCGKVTWPQGPASDDVRRFANDEDKWISTFQRAWKIATTNGFSLSNLQDS
mmetsp:Transcript_119160/g.254182  ORF Transcript_119160/g.254182 Transcript_119160/m.254182 type:complete len:510 (-) Transcript_119160:432-1961(-)